MKAYLYKYWAVVVLSFVTIVGVALFVGGYRDVVQFTPVYIVTVMVVQLIEWRAHKKTILQAWLTAGLIGFIAELVGVHTGLLFGDYVYGSVLGATLFDVPLLVGLLWGFVVGSLWALMPVRYGLKRIPIVALLAVIYDIPLEHFAVRYGLWAWHGSIPLTNAHGWAVVSASIALIFHLRQVSLPPTKSVQSALILQSIFFIALLLLY